MEYLIDIRDLNEILHSLKLRIRTEFPTLEDLFIHKDTPKIQLRKFPKAMHRSALVLNRVSAQLETNQELNDDFWDNINNEDAA